MTGALSFGLDTAFLMGNGVGKPQGILSSPSLITVAKDASQTTSTVIGANLLAMMARLHPACEAGAVWLCSPSVRQYLYTISQETGNSMAGTARTVTSIDTRLFIMGRPVVCTEKLPAIGVFGDLILWIFRDIASSCAQTCVSRSRVTSDSQPTKQHSG